MKSSKSSSLAPHAAIGRRNLLAALGLSLAAGPLLAQQTAYPTKPIRIVVPFTPGGSTDILARTIGQKLTEAWGQPVVIENVPGAGGSIGAEKVAKATPDGYTLLMGHIGTLAVTPSIYPKLPYDPVKSFAPVAWVANVPNVLVVHPSVPVKNVQELVAYARANPGKINYGSGGNGSAGHLAGEMFKGFEADQWYGVVAPAGTPADIVAKLNATINASLSSPEMSTRLRNEGAIAMPSTPEAFGKQIAAELARWKPVVSRAGIKPE